MRCVLLLTIAVLFWAATPVLASELPEPIQGGYSTEPLRAPIFDEAQVAVETMAINNWLNSNIQNLTYEQMKGPREHLYYLIDSRVKQIYASEKRVLPKEHDLILEILFSWAEPLGVFGGTLAFNAVRSPRAVAKTPPMKLPDGIALNLTEDLFTVRSEMGWSISFPYYFMIWNIGDFTAKDGGPRTQLVTLSTGATKDKSSVGRSQATLMFLFSPQKDERFEEYWRSQLGIRTEVKPQDIGVGHLTSRHVVDEGTKLHKEFTSWQDPSGTVAVAYLGIEGTYEWNRPHFIDFVGIASARKEARPNYALQRTPPATRAVPSLAALTRRR